MPIARCGSSHLRPVVDSAKWQLATAVIACCIAISAAACSASVSVQPFGLPIEFSINTQGDISISLKTSVVTPFARIGFNVEALEEAPNGNTLVVVEHMVAGGLVADQAVLKGRREVAVCIDGRFYGEVKAGTVRISALDYSGKIRLVDPEIGQKQCYDSAVDVPAWREVLSMPEVFATISPDGNVLVSTAGVRDASSGELIGDRVNGPQVSFSPDGAYIAASGEDGVEFYSPASGRPLGAGIPFLPLRGRASMARGGEVRVSSLAFAPKGKIAIGYDSIGCFDADSDLRCEEDESDGIFATVWDYEDEFRRIEPDASSSLIIASSAMLDASFNNGAESLEFSADGERLAAVHSGRVTIWRSGGLTGEGVLLSAPTGAKDVSFSSKGDLLAVSSIGAITVFDVATGDAIQDNFAVAGGDTANYRIAFSPVEEILAVRTEKSVYFVDPRSGSAAGAPLDIRARGVGMEYSLDGGSLIAGGNLWRRE